MARFDPLPSWAFAPPEQVDGQWDKLRIVIQPRCSYCRSASKVDVDQAVVAGQCCYCSLCPYAEGFFPVQIEIPSDYPFRPPRIKLETVGMPSAFISEGLFTAAGGMLSSQFYGPACSLKSLLDELIDNLFEPLGYLLDEHHTEGVLHDPWVHDQWAVLKVLLLALRSTSSPFRILSRHNVEQIFGLVYTSGLVCTVEECPLHTPLCGFLNSRRAGTILASRLSHFELVRRAKLRIEQLESSDTSETMSLCLLGEGSLYGGNKREQIIATQHTTVEELKEMIWLEHIRPLDFTPAFRPLSNIVIVFGHKQLQDGRTLQDYNISDGCEVHISHGYRKHGCWEAGSTLGIVHPEIFQEMRNDWASFDARVREVVATKCLRPIDPCPDE